MTGGWGWDRIRTAAADPAELGDLAGGWSPLPRRDPVPDGGWPSLADRPVATSEDVLTVVAHVRCGRGRDILAAVLHLDRSRRHAAPLLLAELLRVDHEQYISAESRAGEVSTGDRIAEIRAVPIGLHDWPDGHSFRLDCPGSGQSQHLVTPGELREAAAAGRRRIQRALQARRPVRPLAVEHDHAVSTWATGRDR